MRIRHPIHIDENPLDLEVTDRRSGCTNVVQTPRMQSGKGSGVVRIQTGALPQVRLLEATRSRRPAIEDPVLRRVARVEAPAERLPTRPDPLDWLSGTVSGANASVYGPQARPIRFAPPQGAFLDRTA